jgi:hypothetical protein
LPSHWASGSRARVDRPSPWPACARSLELPVPATLAHCQALCLAPSSAPLSHYPHLPQLPVVSILSTGITRWSTGWAHRRTPLRGLLASAPPFPFSVHASRSPCFPGARAPLLVPSLGQRWPAAIEPRHHSAIIADRTLPELHQLNRLVHLTHLTMGSTVVLTPRPGTSPMVSYYRRWLLPLSGEWHVGPWVPLSVTDDEHGCTASGRRSDFSG